MHGYSGVARGVSVYRPIPPNAESFFFLAFFSSSIICCCKSASGMAVVFLGKKKTRYIIESVRRRGSLPLFANVGRTTQAASTRALKHSCQSFLSIFIEIPARNQILPP